MSLDDRHGADPFEVLRAVDMTAAAVALGLPEAKRDSYDRTFGCPACKQPLRHRKTGDRRGAVSVVHAGRGWTCHQCGVGGDVVDMLSLGRFGCHGRELRRVQVGELLRWAGAAGLLGGATPSAPAPRTATPTTPDKPDPPPVDLRAMWRATAPLCDDPAAAAWLRDVRGLDPARVEDLGEAAPRVLPVGAKLPRWARGPGGPWTATGHRVLFEAVDGGGVVRSLRARRIGDGDGPKELAPAGCRASGLVVACPLARLWLRGAHLADGRPAAGEVERVGLVVVEGTTDWATAASEHSDADEDAPAVLGIWAGSWTPSMAAKVPYGCRVTVATDDDDKGDAYATQIFESLRERPVELFRWRPRKSRGVE